jgi:hypothetical protein
MRPTTPRRSSAPAGHPDHQSGGSINVNATSLLARQTAHFGGVARLDNVTDVLAALGNGGPALERRPEVGYGDADRRCATITQLAVEGRLEDGDRSTMVNSANPGMLSSMTSQAQSARVLSAPYASLPMVCHICMRIRCEYSRKNSGYYD